MAFYGAGFAPYGSGFFGDSGLTARFDNYLGWYERHKHGAHSARVLSPGHYSSSIHWGPPSVYPAPAFDPGFGGYGFYGW
ncbi:unnamed protein product [Rotaria sp. Silwood1]|nr:unnamed protein product [Rotaria sp. Silwood1]CAF1313562.1 unnamed protein product [Rotaria sp. Silwood1]CAF1315239.1 unnamed protein product [Rotaria sp. Silwood1]CAF3491964.1 unnamed protein product [Rotaria sp. Silwood1]CAF3522179.1 unnamed protein product [Rotaria sp. Silwood1]